MPSERILVGGGTIYDPTAGSQSSNYYKFNCYDFYKYASTSIRLGGGYILSPSADDIGYVYANYAYNITTNNLFTGILPYQNPYENNYYCNSLYYWSGTNPLTYIYFDFNLPVVLTKYRMWNGFVNGIGNIYPGTYIRYSQRQQSPLSSNIGSDYPREWILYGTNDFINWTTVDTRSSQTFSYATSKLCSSSPYNEYSISSPAAYKVYRLAVTKGSTNLGIGVNCSKSGCQYYNYPFFQLGEMQLYGYEDPSTSCSIHGFDKLLDGVSYSGDTNIKNVFGLGSPYSGHDFRKSDVFVNGTGKSRIAWVTTPFFRPSASASLTGVVDLGQNIKVTSYNIKTGSNLSWNPFYSDGSPTSWKVYGSTDNTNWTLLQTVSNNTSTNASSYTKFNLTTTGYYRYYKFSFTQGTRYAGGCDKSGCPYPITIGDIQLIGVFNI